MEHGKVTIVLVDDHSESLSGIADLISTQADMRVVGTAVNGELSVDLCASLQPDVAVVDLRLPGINGLEAARRICLLSGQTRVLMISAGDAPPWNSLEKAGILKFVPKSRMRHELLSAIRDVAARGKT